MGGDNCLAHDAFKPTAFLKALISQKMTLEANDLVIFHKFFVKFSWFLQLRHLADYHPHPFHNQGNSMLQILQIKSIYLSTNRVWV